MNSAVIIWPCHEQSMNVHAIASQMLQDCKHLRKGSLVQQPLYVFYYQVNLREGCKKILVKDRSVYKIAQHLCNKWKMIC